MKIEMIENIRKIKWKISEDLVFTIDVKSADLKFLSGSLPHDNLTELTVKDFIITSYIFGFPIILCSETGMGKTYNIDHFINSFGLKDQTYYWSPTSKIDDIIKFKKTKNILFLDHFNLTNYHINKNSREILDNEIKSRIRQLKTIKQKFDFIIGECIPALSRGYVSWGVLDLKEMNDFLFVPITANELIIDDLFLSHNKEDISEINKEIVGLLDNFRDENKSFSSKLTNRQKYSLIALLTTIVKNPTENTEINFDTINEFPWNRIGEKMENELIKWLKEYGYTY